MSFFEKLRERLEDVPAKTKLLKSLGLSISYTGLRYFLQGHRKEPSQSFMDKMCNAMEYDYIQIPIKRDEESQKKLQSLNDQFMGDLDSYLEQFNEKSPRRYKKNHGDISASQSISTFEVEKDLLDPDKQLDISDLF
jgi:uncharacterized protein YpiB (UPF0302 family)